jgi:uncharacterized Zn finger protein (UPF0148 family)
MDKYAVEQPITTKHAGAGCPLCGRPLERSSNVVLCPVHGTEPFEHGVGEEGEPCRSSPSQT